MSTILSPAETLGLSGAALDGRVRNALRHVADTTFRRVAERLKADAFENDMIYEHEGVPEAIRIMLRPLLAYREQLTYVHHVCIQLTETFKRLPQLYLEDEDVRRVLAISEAEDAWLREMWTPAHSRNNPIYGRLDAVCDFAAAGWQDSLKFMEPNLSGVGGIHFTPVTEKLVMRDIVPTLLAHDPDLAIELPQDQRDLFVQLLIDHSRSIGREASQLCFIEPKYSHDGPDEQSVLSKFLSERYGLVITHADPRELRAVGDEVYYGDVRVDVAYRDYETRDLIALEEEEGKKLEAMRLLFKQNRIVSSIVGDFDHKSCFELLTDPVLAEKLVSPEDRRLFERHVLWTRIVGERRTTLANGSEGDLLSYARANRATLVLKPNRAYGGTGVMVGSAASQEEWERALDEAAAKERDPNLSWVLQAATAIPVVEFPVAGADGRVYGEPFYSVMGFAPTETGLGVLCRVSQKQVVNVAQHGGLAAVLVVDAPKDLRIPKRSLKRVDGTVASLRAEIAELIHLDQTIALMEWDQETKLAPGGRGQRAEQMATLEAIRHNRLVSDRLGDLIEEASLDAEGDAELAREILLLKRERKGALTLPEELVRHYANAKSQAISAWEEARVKDDFGLFAVPFAQLLGLVRERAECLAAGREVYDALLDEFEPGMTRSRLEPYLMEMRERLVPLVAAASEKTASAAGILKGRHFEAVQQWELSRRVLSAMGFDFARGRLDPSTHPFTMMMGRDDVRVTSRVHEDDITCGLLATIHEGGHALYDQNIREEDRDRLIGISTSMGLHECQARLWENHVGRARAFADYLAPMLHELFPEAMKGIDADAFHRGINAVRAGTNRVNADEMSYHLHIVLRYELETALLSGALAASELPEAWNAKSRALLGVVPETPREGVLQDVHWAAGLFGYFPTYTIGSLYAAQLVETYGKTGDLSREMREANFAGLKSWLGEHVHQHGNRAPAEDIIREATGLGLDTAAYFRHLDGAERAWNF
jgi:carboxypeptidase Taq